MGVAALLAAAPAAAQAIADPTGRAPEVAPPADPAMEEARALFRQGVELSRQERWGEALEFFRRSYALAPRPNTLFNMAGIYVRLGRGTDAVEAYQGFLASAPPDDPDRPAAERALALAESSVGHLELAVTPADASVRIDGRRTDATGPVRQLLLDPGQRALSISAPGFVTQNLIVSALPGDTGRQTIELLPVEAPEAEAPPPPAAPQRELRSDAAPAHWLIAIGAVLSVAGGALLGVGLADWYRVEHPLDTDRWSDLEPAYQRAPILTPVGAVTLGVGLVGAGLGLGWALGVSWGVQLDEAP